MKNFTNRLAILLVLLMLSICSYGQKRENHENTLTVLATSPFLTKYKSWWYNSDNGKWSSSNNNGSVLQESFQTKVAIVNGEKYYFLIHTYWDDYYEYPALEIGLKYYKARKVYYMEEDDFKKLFNLPLGTHVFDLHFYTYFRASDNTDNEIKNPSSAHSYKAGIWKKIVKFIVRREDNETFRFLAPESRDSYISYISRQSVEDLKEKYYELPWSVWKTLDLSNK